MNMFKEQLQKEAEKLRLTPEERRLMRVAIEAHMLAHPLGGMKSPWGMWMRVSQFAVAPLAILLVFAGTAYAAAGSLPGDLLYPVKIHVNEPVEVALATTPQAQVAVQQHLAKERVSEAQALAAAGKLDATTTQELQDNFDVHASEAIAVAEQVILQSATTSAASSTPTTTTPDAATTSASSVTFASAATTSGEEASTTKTKDTEDEVDSLKASLTIQSNIFKMLRLHIKTTTRDAVDDGAPATTTSSSTESVYKENSHREGSIMHARRRW